MKQLIVTLALLKSQILLAQFNLVPNWSFESGHPKEDCIYYEEYIDNTIDRYIANWRIAKHRNGCNSAVHHGLCNGSSPEWFKISSLQCSSRRSLLCGRYLKSDGNNFNGNSSGSPSFDLSSESYIYIKHFAFGNYNPNSKKYDGKSYHNAIRVELLEKLKAGRRYVMRMKIIPYSKYYQEGTKILSSGDNHLRIFFTQKGEDWTSNQKNQRIEPGLTNIVINQNVNQNCQWYQTERRFNVPTSMSELKHLILYVERGAFGIDEVEIFEECPSTMFIENKVFETALFGRYPYLDGFPYVNQATGYIYSSNTTVKNGARVIFSAGNEVILNNDVNIELGAEVLIEITGCYTHAPSSIIAAETPSVNYELSKVFYDDGDENEVDKFSEEDDEGDVDFEDNPSEQAKTTPAFNQNNRKNKFSFHPNPTNNYLEISADQPDKVFTIIIMDSMGRPVKTQEGVVRSILVDLTSLAPGLYFAKVNDGQKIFVEKVVLSKN
jgi:hypothetical protein